MADQLLDLAGGNHRLADVLRQHLEHLAEHGDDMLREMASAVLHDDAPLRELALSDAYGTALGQAFNRFWDHYQTFSAEERQELDDGTRAQLHERRT